MIQKNIQHSFQQTSQIHMNNFKHYFPLIQLHTQLHDAHQAEWELERVHPEFLRKTKTPQNDSETIIAWHIVNLNPSLHVYQHFKTEIRTSKLIYTARTIVERGILATVSKTHFTPLEKKNFPPKNAAWWESKSKWVGFSPLIPEAKEPGCGTGPWIAENGQLLRTETFAGIVSVQKKLRLRMKPEKIQHDRSSVHRSSPVRIPPGSSVSPVAWVDRAVRQQLSSCAASAHGLWANWCSISIHPTGDLLRVISMISSSSSVHGLLDQLLWRGRHFVQSGYCGTISDAWEEYRLLRRWKEKRRRANVSNN